MAEAKAATVVKVHFIEALDTTDSIYSEKYKNEYVAAIGEGVKLTEAKLKEAGYKVEITKSFYKMSDPAQAMVRAQAAVKDGAWILFGPQRSNHYLLLAKGAALTPTVSLMASADDLAKLAPLHLSFSPSNGEMARAAAEEATRRTNDLPNEDYMTIVGADCLTCRDFAHQFDLHAAKKGLRKVSEISAIGEQPDIVPIEKEVAKLRPAFILSPNYSVLSGHLISHLHASSPKTFFVGGDGWGNAKFGLVHNGKSTGDATGFNVNGTPPIEKGLETFALGQELLKSGQSKDFHGTTVVGILKFFDSLTTLLCEEKPQSSEKFTTAFTSNGKKLFSAPWGTSLFELKNRDSVFLKTLKVK